MRLNDFIEGLEILKAYYDNPNGYHIGAEHDEFYAYKTDRPMPPEAVQKMLSLGWFQTDGGAHEETPQDYNPESGWMAYT
jgi:hypothetical protein